MINPGDIYRTRNGTVLLAIKMVAWQHNVDWWEAFALSGPRRAGTLWECESYWLEGQEKLT